MSETALQLMDRCLTKTGVDEYGHLEKKIILPGNIWDKEELILDFFHDQWALLEGVPSLMDVANCVYDMNEDTFRGMAMMDMLYEGTIYKGMPEQDLDALLEEGIFNYVEFYTYNYDYQVMDTMVANILDEHALVYIIDVESDLHDHYELHELHEHEEKPTVSSGECQNVLFGALGFNVYEKTKVFSCGSYNMVKRKRR